MRVYLIPIIRRKRYKKKEITFITKKRKQIIIFKFFIPIKKLCIFNSMPNYQYF